MERYREQWCGITSDRLILNTVSSYKVELSEKKTDQIFIPCPIEFSDLETEEISHEMSEFARKGIIEPVFVNDPDEFISNIFARLKSDAGIRIILNLKPFNKNYVDKIHFKMESLKSAVNTMTKDFYFASLDLKDAYYSINIREIDRNVFRFYWQGQKFQFTSLIMGLSTSARVLQRL